MLKHVNRRHVRTFQLYFICCHINNELLSFYQIRLQFFLSCSLERNRGCKRYVVYCRTNKEFILKKGSWESKLLNTPDIRLQLEDILKKGCRLFVRHYLINKATSWEKTLGCRDHYDYAWTCPRYRKTQRLVPYKLYS